MSLPFKGRTIATISDLSIQERALLYVHTRKLKKAIAENDTATIDEYKINDPNYGVSLIFIEDSTRTKESFRNAASFHNTKVHVFDSAHSSFNKKESYADTINMLTGYQNNMFIIRSKLEGACRWLEYVGNRYAQRHNTIPPIFINAGDGKHEHPTQELLDEFTLLEENNWNQENIHIALIGDLYHGRTVHSKVDGLRLFKQVKVDLIAPEELAMPQHYIEQMKHNGFEVTTFPSIDAYLSQNQCARLWYFTRPQLERMGENILRKQDELREKITLRENMLSLIHPNTKFYHPLPRHKEHPTIPIFIDDTKHNGYELQSKNGYFIRIVLMALLQGKIKTSSTIEEAQYNQNFIKSVAIKQGTPKEHKEGIRPISQGIVIDHICKGDSPREINQHMNMIYDILNLNDTTFEAIDRSKATNQFKGMLCLPNRKPFSENVLKKLAALSPNCTVNIIEHANVMQKLRLEMPPKIYGFENISCKNEQCISHPSHAEHIPITFLRKNAMFVCEFCETPHTYKEVWDNI